MRKGFTLIELLVVIAIIAILAAILFPVFARAREKARQTSCLSNLKQLSLSMLMYVQDYDERFPVAWRYVAGYVPPGYNATNYVTWADLIMPYVRNDQIFQCATIQFEQWQMAYGTFPFAYYYNMAWNTYGGADYLPGNSLGGIGHPATTIMLADGFGTMDAYWDASLIADLYSGIATYGVDPGVVRRHNEGANYAFCDGHAKWQKTSSRSQWTVIADPN